MTNNLENARAFPPLPEKIEGKPLEEEPLQRPSFTEATFDVEQRTAQIVEGLYITPFENRVIIRRNKFVQASRIYIPDTAQQKPTTGEVVGLGPDAPEYLQLNQIVVFSIYGGVPVNFKNGIEYLMMRPEEIYGILNVSPEEVKEESPA